MSSVDIPIAGNRVVAVLLLTLGLTGAAVRFSATARAACDENYGPPASACVTAPINGRGVVRPPSSIELTWDYEDEVDTVPGAPVAISVDRATFPQWKRLASFDWDAANPRRHFTEDGLPAGEHVYRVCLFFVLREDDNDFPVEQCSSPFGATIPGAPTPLPPLPTSEPPAHTRWPEAPTNVHAEILSPTSVRVSWVPGVRTRTIEVVRLMWPPPHRPAQCVCQDGAVVAHLSLNDRSVVDNGARPLHSVSYLVCASNEYLRTNWREQELGGATCTSSGYFVMPPGPPEMPRNVRVSETNQRAHVTWENVDDTVISFRVERQVGGEWRTTSGPLSQRTTGFTDPEPLPAVIIAPRVYRVCAHNVTDRTCSGPASLGSDLIPPTPRPSNPLRPPDSAPPPCLTCRR